MIKYRLYYLLISWSLVGIIYQTAAHLQGAASVLTPSFIDDLIPFTPYAIWLYLSFFIIIPSSFIFAPYSRIRWMSFCFIISALIASCCYILFPTTLIYPAYEGSAISSSLLNALISIDTPQNCLPSLHVALTIIVVWAIIEKKHLWLSLGFTLWGGRYLLLNYFITSSSFY